MFDHHFDRYWFSIVLTSFGNIFVLWAAIHEAITRIIETHEGVAFRTGELARRCLPALLFRSVVLGMVLLKLRTNFSLAIPVLVDAKLKLFWLFRVMPDSTSGWWSAPFERLLTLRDTFDALNHENLALIVWIIALLAWIYQAVTCLLNVYVYRGLALLWWACYSLCVVSIFFRDLQLALLLRLHALISAHVIIATITITRNF